MNEPLSIAKLTLRAARMEWRSSLAEIGMHKECIATLLDGEVDPAPVPNVRNDSEPNKAVSNICSKLTKLSKIPNANNFAWN